MLDVAERRFASEGFHGVTMDEIAEEVGVSKPMIYAYFESKEGLYHALMVRAREQLFAAIDEAVSVTDPPDEQLWSGVLAFLTFVEGNREAWTVLFLDAPTSEPQLATEWMRVREQTARLVHQLLGEATEARGLGPEQVVATEPIAHALVGAGESMAHWWLANPEHPKEAAALWLTNFAWTGFGRLIEGETWAPRGASGKKAVARSRKSLRGDRRTSDSRSDRKPD
jgi:AcrR family transcriptional regulator